MTAPIVAFCNSKGGLGKTSLVYHLSWMFADRGYRVLAADLDPQANLTLAFLDEPELEQIWSDDARSTRTVWDSLRTLQGGGDLAPAPVRTLDPLVGLSGQPMLIPGDLDLSSFEDDLSLAWAGCLAGEQSSFEVTTAFARLLHRAADEQNVDVVLVDLAPNLGAINRAALVGSDHVVIPLVLDLFSIRELRNLGPTLRRWRSEWVKRRAEAPGAQPGLPTGAMRPAGYILSAHRGWSPGSFRWAGQIPAVYRSAVLGEPPGFPPPVADDPHCIAQLKHYHSLASIGMEAHKPVFALKAADGAFGGHAAAAQRAYSDYSDLAERLASRLGIRLIH